MRAESKPRVRRWKSVMLLSCHAHTTHAAMPASPRAWSTASATAGVIFLAAPAPPSGSAGADTAADTAAACGAAPAGAGAAPAAAAEAA